MLAGSLCVVAGFYVAGGRDNDLFLVPWILTALVTGMGNVINDYFDVEIDRVNKPRRPLPSGRLSARSAVRFYALATAALTVTIIATQSARVSIVLVAWEILLFTYAARIKRVPVLGNLVVASVTSSAFWFGSMLAGSPAASAMPVAIAFMFVMSREVIKSAEDVDGDAPSGVGTIAVVVGEERARSIAAVIMLVLAILIPVPAIVGHYEPGYFWLMEGLVVPSLIVSSLIVIRNPCRRTFNRASWILKAGMFFGIVGIALARW